MPVVVVVMALQLLVLMLCCFPMVVKAGFGLGDYRIDVDFFGGEGDLSPAQ